MIRKTLTICAAAAALLTAGYWFGMADTAQAQSNRVFELRTYTANEGKLPDLQKRFREHTLDLFKKHGMTNIAYWTPQDKPLSENTLIYVISHASREEAKKNWAGFNGDPDWKKAAAESEVNGKLVKGVVSVFMDATDYSPMK